MNRSRSQTYAVAESVARLSIDQIDATRTEVQELYSGGLNVAGWKEKFRNKLITSSGPEYRGLHKQKDQQFHGKKSRLREDDARRIERGAPVIHSTGFYQANRSIEQDNIGLRLGRYKTGSIYDRDPAADHPYCWIWTINIGKDCDGAGTYGPSYATYTGKDLVTCPKR